MKFEKLDHEDIYGGIKGFERKKPSLKGKLLKLFAILTGLFIVAAGVGLGVLYNKVPTLNLGDKVVTSLPDDSPQEARFIVFGDMGYPGSGFQDKVAQLAEELCQKENPTAVIITGDNFYMDGIKGADDPNWTKHFVNMYNSPCLSKLKFYSSFGNHDYRGNQEALINKTNENENWVLPARAYSVHFGDLLDLFVLDSNVVFDCKLPFCAISQMEKRMQKSTARWKVAMAHHPLLSVGKYKKPKAVRSYFMTKALCNGGIKHYISGHDHNLQHLAGVPRNSPCSIHQWISGAGGAPLSKVTPEINPDISKFGKSESGLLLFKANPEKLVFQFYGIEKGAEFPLYSYEDNSKPGLDYVENKSQKNQPQ